jgi:D-alanyl-D-alanine carboxypeptidase (penicillin-binding protein 5/6)
LDEQIITSAYAKSMGGSQVFLEEGEKQTVETLIKCIVVASGNDACVVMAEHISGTEEKFVELMNEKAKELGMKNTNFEDCCGLSDSDNHYTSAYDVAIMAKELIVKYPEIYNYSKIWMENIIHVTDKGESEFGLSNTNKLLKQYEYTTGLKTGSTSKAKYCVAATARKGDVDLIAVIMGAPDYKIRFKEAKAILEYGFGICKLYRDDNSDLIKYIKVKGGESDQVKVMAEKAFTYVSTTEEGITGIKKDMVYNKKMVAPINKGDTIGEINYYINNNKIGTVNIIACENIKKAGYIYRLKQVFMKYLI